MEVKIQTKFNKGDRVGIFWEEDEYKTITCPFCNGNGYIDLDFEFPQIKKIALDSSRYKSYMSNKLECKNCKNGEIRIRTGAKRVKQGECIIEDFKSISADGRIYYSVKNVENGRAAVWGEYDLEYIGGI